MCSVRFELTAMFNVVLNYRLGYNGGRRTKPSLSYLQMGSSCLSSTDTLQTPQARQLLVLQHLPRHQ